MIVSQWNPRIIDTDIFNHLKNVQKNYTNVMQNIMTLNGGCMLKLKMLQNKLWRRMKLMKAWMKANTKMI